ncbi:MAG: rRNA maturation RNase YbeY [Paludibacteraceae bacterium]|nr:rRNA maturation RNase YbeY [Paludibacteraceae bacterium]
MIVFHTENTDLPPFIDRERVKLTQWISAVAAHYGFGIGEIHYILCNDERILEVNRQFLQHDYYTDVITFDYSTASRITGDIYISIDTVQSNAEETGCSFEQELCRILIHGVLHLTGQADKTPETKAVMTQKEDYALSLLS